MVDEAKKDPVITNQASEAEASGKEEEGQITDAANRRDEDVAARFLERLDPAIMSEPITRKEARKLLWKIDLTMISLITCTTILAAVDKVIISNAEIYGMKQDAHLGKNQYSWVGSIFYFGYLVADYPSSFLIQRLPNAKLLATCCLIWAILMLCTAATKNFAGLAVTRFLMGTVEAFIFPIMSIFTVMWWTTGEQPIRLAFWFNQVESKACLLYNIPSHNHLTVLVRICRHRELRYWSYAHQSPPVEAPISCPWRIFSPMGSGVVRFPPRFARAMLVA